MIRDPLNDQRIVAYLRRSAPYRSANPIVFQRRYMRGLAIQRDLYTTRSATNVVVLTHPKQKVKA